MSPRSLPLALALLLCATPALAASLDSRHTPATPEETARTVKFFKESALRSMGPRSGDLFALPNKYNYIIEGSYLAPTHSHVEIEGQTVTIAHRGNHHGTVWDYDVRIPLVLYGPGYVKGGTAFETPATQQDIAVTLAHVLDTVPPEDARGRVLDEALIANAKKPKAVLVLAFDQGGVSLYDRHPGSYPFVESLWKRGARYTQARVTHIDPETVVGHTAIGTGAYPSMTGIVANRPWIRSVGKPAMAVAGSNGSTPVFVESPSFADVWLEQTRNQAIVIAQSLADRAAIGMVGHGSWYGANKKPIVNWYDEKTGGWTTNETFYTQPGYLKGMRTSSYYKAIADAQGEWMGHAAGDPSTVRRTPAAAAFDGDAMMAMIEREPVGQDETPDLIYWSMKASDYVGHSLGHESLEARAVLKAQDAQVKRVIEALERKVGRDRLLVVFTADHGGAPLAELSGGSRMAEDLVLKLINERFDKRPNGVPVAEHVTSTQVYLNDAELAANGLKPEDIKGFLQEIKVDGRPFFAAVFTRAEIEGR